MQKLTDHICPNCRTHLYAPAEIKQYICKECGTWVALRDLFSQIIRSPQLTETQALPVVESMADLVSRDPAHVYHQKRMERVDSKAIAEAIVAKAERKPGGVRELWDAVDKLLKARPL
jgi:hypothetical protein